MILNSNKLTSFISAITLQTEFYNKFLFLETRKLQLNFHINNAH